MSSGSRRSSPTAFSSRCSVPDLPGHARCVGGPYADHSRSLGADRRDPCAPHAARGRRAGAAHDTTPQRPPAVIPTRRAQRCPSRTARPRTVSVTMTCPAWSPLSRTDATSPASSASSQIESLGQLVCQASMTFTYVRGPLASHARKSRVNGCTAREDGIVAATAAPLRASGCGTTHCTGRTGATNEGITRQRRWQILDWPRLVVEDEG